MPLYFDQQGNSSSISQFGYDQDNLTLSVQFASGGIYNHFGVPPEVVADMRGAESHGKFYANQIRGRFESEKQSENDDGTAFA